MGDVFKEQIVKKAPTTLDLVKKIGIAAAAGVLSLVLVLTPIAGPFGLFIAVALIFGAYYLFSFFKIEYEYSFTNGSLDIDIIYDKSRRKRLFTGDVKDFDLMARAGDKDKAGEFSSARQTLDYSSGAPGAAAYAFLASHNGVKAKIIFEPNEMMLRAIASALPPRKFFR